MVGNDGTIYVGSSDHNLYAINIDGSKKWAFLTGLTVGAAPSIGADGSLYIGSQDGSVYAINSLEQPQLTLSKTASLSKPHQNDTILYTLTYGNAGLLPASGVIVTDALPANITYVPGSATASGGSYNAGTNTITWTLGGLAVGAAPLPLQFSATVPATTAFGTLISNTASIYCTEVSTPVTSNVVSTVTPPLPVLGLTKTAAPASIGPGGNILYTLKYNVTVFTATGVTITDTLPANTTYVPNSASGVGAYNTATNTVTWALGTVNMGASGQVSFLANIKTNTLPGSIISNTAGIASLEVPVPVTSTAILTVANGGPGDWWMFHHDPQHTARSPFSGPTFPAQKWAFATGFPTNSSPAIGEDGTIYIGSLDGYIYAVKPDGTERWAFNAGSNIESSPAIGADGTIYVGSQDSNLYALNPDGTKKWAFATGGYIFSSPSIGTDGTVYVGSHDFNLYAVNPDGSKKWAFTTGSIIDSSPAIAVDGTIYVGSWDFNLYALNPDGTKKWAFANGYNISSSPAIGADGTIYFGSNDANLYALNPDGTKKWTFNTNTTPYGTVESPTIGADGTIYYLNALAGILYAVNTDGSNKWNFLTGGGENTRAIGSDGTIYIGAFSAINNKYSLDALTPGGSLKWTFASPGNIQSSPAIGSDGTVYIGGHNIFLSAITLGVPAYQPDMLIGSSIAGSIGQNVINATGSGQTLQQTIDAGTSATCYASVVNASNIADSFTLQGADNHTSGVWTVKYYDNDTQADVTASALAATLTVPLAPGATKTYRVVVTGMTTGTVDTVTVTGTSKGDNTKKDVVKDVVSAYTMKPDLTIGTTTLNGIGQNIINLTGVNQTLQQWSDAGKSATCYIAVNNAGGTADTITLQAVDAGGTAWNVQYYDNVTQSNVTASAVAGQLSVTVPAGGQHLYRAAIIGLTPATTDTITATATSATNPAKQDVVKDVVTVNLYQPDLWIGVNTGATAAVGQGIFNTTGLNQTIQQYPNAGQTATCYLTINNLGNTADTYALLAADTGGAGWTAQYFDNLTQANVTASAKAGTLMVSLAAGAQKVYRAAIIGTTQGALDTLTVTTTSQSAGAKQDVVKDAITVNLYQPDMWIGVNAGATAAIGLGVINTTGVNQTLQQWANAGQTATCYLTVNNTGNTADIYTVLAADAGGTAWNVQYYDNLTQANVTASAKAGLTIALAAGGQQVYRATVIGTTQGAVDTLTVTATSQSDATRQDVVKDIMTVNSYQPDMWVGANAGASAASGVGIFNTTGVNQTFQQSANAGQTATCYFTVANAGNTADSYTLQAGDIGGVGWTVQYYDNLTQANVTASATAGQLTVALLSGAQKVYRATVIGTTPGAADTLTVTATSQNDGTKQDVAKDIVSVNSYQPDLWIGANAGASAAIGQGVINLTGLNQTLQQWANAGQTATCYLTINNVGNTADIYTVLAADAGGTAWSVQYFDNLTQANVTASAKAGTLTVSLLAGAQKVYRTAMIGTTPNTQDSLTVTATSQFDGTKQDVVKDVITVNSFQPDVWIGANAGASAAIGQGVLNTTGLNQTLQQRNNAGQVTICYLTVNNTGNTADTCLLLASDTGGAGWTTQYFDNGSGANVTASAVTGQLAVLLPAGGQQVYRAAITGTTQGAVDTVTVTTTSQGNGTQDVVKDVVTINKYQPDIWIGATVAGEIGQGIFTADGTNETIAQSEYANNTASYYLTVQNTGNTADAYNLTAPATAANWAVTYLSNGGSQNITTAITGSGWTTPVLAPGATADCWVTVTPGIAAIGGTNETLLITAKSTTDATRLDVGKAVTTALPQYLPDLQIRNSTDVSYSGVNIYPPDLLDQTKTQTINCNTTAVFPLRVQNNGNSTDIVTLTGPSGGNGWTIQYFNALSGGSAITAQFTGSGWGCGPLAPGATADLRIEVTPDSTVIAGKALNVLVNGKSTGNPSKLDAVQATANVVLTYQPDLVIRTSAETGFTGSDIYNVTGAGQSKTVLAPANQTVTYFFQVRNNGNTTDAFILSGPAATAGWTVQYFDAIGRNITSGITGGTQKVAMAPGTSVGFSVQVTPLSSLPGWSSFNLLMKARSTVMPTQSDVVQALTTLLTYQPDIAIRNFNDTTYAGSGIYNLTGVNQKATQSVLNGVMATYVFCVENNGNSADSLILTGPGSGAGWTVQYIDLSNGADITSAITTTGWKTSTLAPYGFLRYYVRVTPNATLTGGTTLPVMITAASTASTAKDVAIAATTVTPTYQPDLTIKNPGEAGYTGIGIYNQTGAGQSRGQSTETGGEMSYLLLVQNAGNTTDKYTITMPAASPGWRVQYVDQATGVDITSSVTGGGWTTNPLAPGASTGYNLNVWPNNGLVSGVMDTQLITATSAAGTASCDAVQAVSSFVLLHQPDLAIENAGDTAFIGVSIYNTTGTGQAKMQRVPTGVPASYLIQVQNAGLIADSFTLGSSAAATGWTVQFFDAPTGGLDITSQINAGTWKTNSLSPGGLQVIRAQATPGPTAAYGIACVLSITAVSVGNNLDSDTVLASTLRIGPLATTPWAMFHHDLLHSGLSAATGAATNNKKWTCAVSGGAYSSPVIGTDGTVYVGTQNNQLVAIQPTTGIQNWAFTAGGIIQATPAVSANGTIYAGALDNNLYAVNPDGTLFWTFATGGAIHASPAIGNDGTIYFASDDNKLYAVNPNGTLQWSYTLGVPTISSPAYSSPAVGADGTIYIGSRDNNLYAIKPNGALSWTFPTSGPIFSSPSITADGTVVYVGSSDQRLYAVNASGGQKWSFFTQGAVNSSPAIAPDGSIVVGTNDQKVYAFTAAGRQKWTYFTNNWVISSPAIDAGGNIYIGSLDGKLYALTAAGALRWTLTTQNWIYSSPAIGGDGTIYVGSYDGNVYAVGAGALGMNKAAGGAQPDLWIRLASEATYAGVGVINTDGTNQTQTQAVAEGMAATYLCQVANSGGVAGPFTLTGTASESGWTITYYDMATAADITAQVTGTGWQVGSLAPGATRGFYVQVQAGAKAKVGVPFSLRITAVSSDATKEDVVKAVTTRQ